MNEQKPHRRRQAPPKAREDHLPPLVAMRWKKLLRLMTLYPQDLVLDAQCMNGTLLRRLERIRPDAALCGACFTPPQLRAARALVPRADVMFADECDFPWVSECMDVAFIARAFHTLDNPAQTLQELHRVLRRGGQLLIAGVCLPQPLRALCNAALFAQRPNARVRSKAEMIDLMHASGFEKVYFARVSGLCFVMTGLKK